MPEKPVGTLDKGSIIGVCEAIGKEGLSITMPSFHALMYYTLIPNPQIVCRVLDFGIVSRTDIPKIDMSRLKDESSYIDHVKNMLEESFHETADIVTGYVYNMLANLEIDRLYENAVEHPFIEDAKYNLWGDYIAISRKAKIHKLKEQFVAAVVNILVKRLSTCSTDEERKGIENSIDRLNRYIKEAQQGRVDDILAAVKQANIEHMLGEAFKSVKEKYDHKLVMEVGSTFISVA